MAHEGHDHGDETATALHDGVDDARDEASIARFDDELPAFASCPRVLHVDPVGGAAGDMLVAAFIDLGVPSEVLESAVAATGLRGYRLEYGRRDKHAIAARSFEVIVEGEHPARDYATIARMLASSALDDRTRQLAERAFLRLGEAEAKVHRQPLRSVHFHEVGGVDAIVDVVAASAALAHLERLGGRLGVSLGALPLGSGTARGAHGAVPLPAPAMLELTVGLPVRDPAFAEGVRGELVTPTGAALLRAFVELSPSSLGRWPTFVPRAVGYGAGTKDFPDRANVVRLVLGDQTRAEGATYTVLEANVDDTTGEIAASALEALLEAGALDAWAQPITMKKGRPAVTLSALAPASRADALAQTMLAHTGSLGVRRHDVTRHERPRRFIEVTTPYGTVRVKLADGDGLPVVVHPELEDCRARAREHGVPVREVIRCAIGATRA